MFVSGPIGAIDDRLGMLTQHARDELDGSLRSGCGGRRRKLRGPDAAFAVHLGRANDAADDRSRSAFGDRHVIAAVGMEQAERVLGAVPHVGIAADRGDRQDVQLGAGQREADGQRVVQPRVAVDDERERPLDRPDRCGARYRLRTEEGRDRVDRSRPVRIAGAHPVSLVRTVGRPPRARARVRPRLPR